MAITNFNINAQAVAKMMVKKTYKLAQNTFRVIQRVRQTVNPIIDRITDGITDSIVGNESIGRSR